MPDAADANRPPTSTAPPNTSSPTSRVARPSCDTDAVLCDRCRTAMFRMHAVWRCPACGYKTDCCGW